ncbi:hypothetical protein ACXYMX_02145 [Sporosarcina sp. CAU 1771]
MSFPTLSNASINMPVTTGGGPLVLKEGQMIHGQIKQLFPGQMAEIQIGNQKLHAKLEVPMKAGDSYYFQVNSVKPELQLKIISGPLESSEAQPRQLTRLMDAMQLPKSTEMKELLSFVLKNKTPITREALLQAEMLLKTVPPSSRAEALSTLEKIIELKLPLSETVFRSLIGVESKEGLHTVLNALKLQLGKDTSIPLQLKESILASLGNVDKPFVEATGRMILSQSLLTLLNPTESVDSRFASVQLLKSANLLPQQASLANVQQILTALLTEGSALADAKHSNMQSLLKEISVAPESTVKGLRSQMTGLIASDTTNSPGNKEILNSLIDRASSTTQFVRDFGQALARITAENVIASPFAHVTQQRETGDQLLRLIAQQNQPAVLEKLALLVRNAEQSNNPVIQAQVRNAEVAVATAIDGNAVKEAIQLVVRSLGMNYEAGMLNRDANLTQLTDSLKPQLIALMHDSSVSQAVRDSAEVVVTRLNGPLLASGETGVQHQLVMQVPLDFFGKRIDATLQWTGRMKEDGKIDSDFARILFYLDLHSLNQTIIDMQVQNRIVTVTIFNADANLKVIGLPIQESLKKGLEATGYKLSGVFFKEYQEEQVIETTRNQGVVSDQGVDFRI